MKNKKLKKVSGGQKDTSNTFDLTKRKDIYVNSKAGAEVDVSINNFKTSGNISLVNNDEKVTTSTIEQKVIDSTKKITGGTG